jgi:CHAD domain-containing protein
MNTEEQNSSKPADSCEEKLTFPADMRSDEAMKRILLEQFLAMTRNERGILDRSNEEFLHDYRIAIRRSRTALAQIKNVFPEATARKYRNRLALLGKVTTPARDFDVHLVQFEGLRSLLPTPYRADIEPLRDLLRQQADWAYGAIVRELTSTQHQRFLSTWLQFLQTPPARHPRAVHAASPIGELARGRIWKLYRRALKQGNAIKSESPSEQVHELRKTCKKLRYLLEFFRPLFPANSLSRAIKLLKKLQDYLGAFQDVHVQIQTLRQVFPIMRKQSAIPPESLIAVGVLLGRLEMRQAELRQEFSKRFKDFADHKHQTAYRRLFQPPPPTGVVMDKPV